MANENEKVKHVGEEEEEEEEEEYVFLELDDCLYSGIQPNAPYILSRLVSEFVTTTTTKRFSPKQVGAGYGVTGLDTLTPTLIVGDGLKMIGEYEETVGTCYLFSESDAPPKPVHGETAPPKENRDKQGGSSKEAPSKEVKHLASVQKILKFRLIGEDHHSSGAQSMSP
ncbi:unnamed protein product [Alopecurus aequalis]